MTTWLLFYLTQGSSPRIWHVAQVRLDGVHIQGFRLFGKNVPKKHQRWSSSLKRQIRAQRGQLTDMDLPKGFRWVKKTVDPETHAQALLHQALGHQAEALPEDDLDLEREIQAIEEVAGSEREANLQPSIQGFDMQHDVPDLHAFMERLRERTGLVARGAELAQADRLQSCQDALRKQLEEPELTLLLVVRDQKPEEADEVLFVPYPRNEEATGRAQLVLAHYGLRLFPLPEDAPIP